jgi:hypothetical protein
MQFQNVTRNTSFHGITLDSNGEIYTYQNNAGLPGISRVMKSITKINGTTGDIISILPDFGYGPDYMEEVFRIAFDRRGIMYVTDNYRHMLWRVENNIKTALVGTGVAGFSGDGGAGTRATLNRPSGVAVDAAGNVFIADEFNHRIRKWTAATGVVTTIVGSDGNSEADGPGTSASLSYPSDVAVDAIGNVFITDSGRHRICKWTASTGMLTRVVGGWGEQSGGIFRPRGLTLDNKDNIYIVCSMRGGRDNQIMKVYNLTTRSLRDLVNGTSVSIVSGGNPKKTRKVKKSRKTRKVRKSLKTRKVRKSRKSKK